MLLHSCWICEKADVCQINLMGDDSFSMPVQVFHIISVWYIWRIRLWRFMKKRWHFISGSSCSIQLFLLLIYYSLWFSTGSLSQSCVSVISSRNEPVGKRGCNCDPRCSFHSWNAALFPRCNVWSVEATYGWGSKSEGVKPPQYLSVMWDHWSA